MNKTWILYVATHEHAINDVCFDYAAMFVRIEIYRKSYSVGQFHVVICGAKYQSNCTSTMFGKKECLHSGHNSYPSMEPYETRHDMTYGGPLFFSFFFFHHFKVACMLYSYSTLFVVFSVAHYYWT